MERDISGDAVTHGDYNGTSKLCEIRWGAAITKKTLKENFVQCKRQNKAASIVYYQGSFIL